MRVTASSSLEKVRFVYASVDQRDLFLRGFCIVCTHSLARITCVFGVGLLDRSCRGDLRSLWLVSLSLAVVDSHLDRSLEVAVKAAVKFDRNGSRIH